MASRLYRTTRPLFVQVVAALQSLGVLTALGGNPTAFGLVALYVTGLVLLDTRQTQPRISERLPARALATSEEQSSVEPDSAPDQRTTAHPGPRRAQPAAAHDAAVDPGAPAGADRLRAAPEPVPGHARLPVRGLCVDDVVLEQPFAKRLPWAAWTYSHAKKRKVYGVHVVLLSWSSDPAGTWRIPVAFRVWRPKRSCGPGRCWSTPRRWDRSGWSCSRTSMRTTST